MNETDGSDNEDRIRELLKELESLISDECEEFKTRKRNDLTYVRDKFPKMMSVNSELKVMSNMIVRNCCIG